MTSNITTELREILQNNDEALELLEAVIDEYEGKISDLQSELEEKEDEIWELESSEPDNLITINTGLGEIKYIQPDNLKLQLEMDEFIEKIKKWY